jgi:hypothetical protein
MRSTGPILAIGAITVTNQSIIHSKPLNWKVIVATGIAAGMFSLAEKATGQFAVGLSWLALVSVLFARLDPSIPAPAESFAQWWKAP